MKESNIYETSIKETNTVSGEFNEEALLGIRKLLLEDQYQLSPLFIYLWRGWVR
jgi:hypothetical protein